MPRNTISSARQTINENNQNKVAIYSANGTVTDFAIINGRLNFSTDGGQTWSEQVAETDNVLVFNKIVESFKGALSAAIYQNDINAENAAELIRLNTDKVNTTGGAVSGALQIIGNNTFLYIGVNNATTDTVGDVRLANVGTANGNMAVQICTANAATKGDGTWIIVAKMSVIDNLTSTEAQAPLSANQGRALNSLITSLNTVLTTLTNQAVQVVYQSFTTTQQQQARQNIGVDFPTLVNLLYPVGHILMTSNSANPSTYLGVGTWVAWGGGRVPIGMGNNGETNYTTVEQMGGSENSIASHSHSATTQNTSLTGSVRFGRHGENSTIFNGNSGICSLTNQGANTNNFYSRDTQNRSGTNDTVIIDASHNHSTLISSEGSANGNRMPFLTCYMWKRTA